jgi:putative FmdB family regulatory protein
MPLYEYLCEACGHRVEVIQKFSDPLLETCPKCGGPVHKEQSSPAFQFKGTGWYVTDYAKKDGGSGKGGDKAAGGQSDEKKSGTGGETKPETKAETKSSDTTPKAS